MKKIYNFIIISIFISLHGLATSPGNAPTTAGCSTAGTATLGQDSICYTDTTTLVLTGYVGSIQWQSYDGTTWINETGTGSLTDNYSFVPGETKQFRALVTNGICTPDSSNVITITVGLIPVPSGVGATRCGLGNVTLTGAGNGTLRWYLQPTGGSFVGTGSPFSPLVTSTTTFYLEDNSDGGGGDNVSPILVTEADLDDFNGGDDFEITNVAPYPVDVTGWQVAVGDDYGNINAVNAIVTTLSGIMAPSQIMSWSDNFSDPTYWGSNFLWSGGLPTLGGWIAIIDNNNTLVEFAVWGFTTTDIQNASLVINGNTYTVGSAWVGNPINNTAAFGNSLARTGNMDHNDGADWIDEPNTIAAINSAMTVPFIGLGCSSPRVPVLVTVTSTAAVTLSSTLPALCLGQSSQLSATSTNPGYTYTWSPATGLSSTSGPSVTATPTSPVTYVVIGNDGTCASSDTLFLDVGPLSNSGTASSTVDTICLGNTAILTTVGSVGTIQWQSYNGSAWVNETGTGSNSDTYIVSPSQSTQYQAVVTSGGCPSANTVTLPMAVLSVTPPTTVNTTACSPGSVTLNATSTGDVVWYSNDTTGYLGNGTPFTTTINGTTTFYASSRAGSTINVGPVNNSFGNSAQSGIDQYGLNFDVSRLSTLDKVYVYATQTGNLIINLREFQGGSILKTDTQYVVASVGKQEVSLGFDLNPGTNYRLEIGLGSVSLRYNYNNASYPYTVGNNLVSITGYLSPYFNTGTQYLYFYDWVVFEGCTSTPRTPLNVTAIPAPAVPAITQNSGLLTATSTTGNQWFLNGNSIPGATNQTLVISQTGLYSVTVTGGNGCTASASLNVTFIGIDELQAAGISVYPNPVTNVINIDFMNGLNENASIRLLDITGAVVIEQTKLSNSITKVDIHQFATGVYTLEVIVDNKVLRRTMVKL